MIVIKLVHLNVPQSIVSGTENVHVIQDTGGEIASMLVMDIVKITFVARKQDCAMVAVW